MRPNPFRRFDPRAKCAALLVAGLQVVFSGSPLDLAAPGAIALAGIAAAGWSPRESLRLLRTVVWFGILVVGSNAMTIPGEVVFTGSAVSVTREGLETGGLFFTKLVLLVLLSRLFTFSTPLPEVLDALDATTGRVRTLLLPFLTLLSVTLGLAPVLVTCAEKIRRSYLARGGRTGGLAALRFARAAAVPLFISTIRSADALAEAMKIRGFTPGGERTPFRRLRMRLRDALLVAGVSALSVPALL